MKISKSLIYKLSAVLFLILIAIWMMIIGRSHTVYLDNKTFENLTCPYKIEVQVKGNAPSKLYARERGQAFITGQNLRLTLIITEKKNGDSITENYKVKVPYSMDAMSINLNALRAGISKDKFLEEFIIVTKDTKEDSTVNTDEFSMGDI